MARRVKVAVLYGGRSSEHEISIITALQAMEAIDPLAYEILPIYITLEGKWYTGDLLYEKSIYRNFEKRKKELQEITLLPSPEVQGFLKVKGTSIDLKNPLKVDVCLLTFHGQYGEDGCIQGLLELADLPYTGSKVLASSLAMHKTLSKKVAESENIPVVPYIQVKRKDALLGIEELAIKIEDHFENKAYPFFVKPVHLGSSIAVSKASDRSSLKMALAKTFQFDSEALVEEYITPLFEVNVSVIDKAISAVEIPIASKEILSYEDKYQRRGRKTGEALGMASLERIINPPDLHKDIKESVERYALKLFSSLEVEGIVRFDFIYDVKKEKLYFNEVNPLPGSLSFYLWEKTDPPLLYPDLIRYLIESALEKKREQESLLPLIGFKAF